MTHYTIVRPRGKRGPRNYFLLDPKTGDEIPVDEPICILRPSDPGAVELLQQHLKGMHPRAKATAVHRRYIKQVLEAWKDA